MKAQMIWVPPTFASYETGVDSMFFWVALLPEGLASLYFCLQLI